MEKIAKENITPDQRRELVDFIKLHPQLNSGKFTNEFTFKKAQELWQSLENNMNAFPAGAHKEWKKWRKTWHDIKTRTKSKSSMIKQHRKRTGGGPPTAINITTQEEEVLGIMGEVIVDGHPGISESLVEFDVLTMLPDQTSIDHDHAFGVSQREDSEIHVEENPNYADENDPPLEVPPVSKQQSSFAVIV
ncbi:unnamed protein product [Phaedon cochleariae]|uniref:Regulatory protein zeste n=1 Tax=Phaedon cochleariae TaxID=80249 RepID=A0A9N9SCL7_PHACE|nr:unnamed protein product [Phaedon cochleariae]